MSELRSAIDGIDDPVAVDDGELLDTAVELARHLAMLEARMVGYVAEIDRRRSFEHDGQVTTTAWLKHRCGYSPGAASLRVQVARRLAQMPLTRETFRAGDLDLTRVGDLASAHRRHPEVFARDEQVLVDNAVGLSVRDHRRALAYWQGALDHQAAERDQTSMRRRRSLYLSETSGGMTRLDGELDPESAAIVRTALATLADPVNLDPDDRRTPAQTRADALVDICSHRLDHRDDLPTSHGLKPHLSVLVDLAVLTGDGPGRRETESGRLLSPETIRRIGCDSRITRIVTDGEGQPLDVGRTTRTVTPAQWRALVVRDRGCVTPGCDRPPGWCDAHHKTPWAMGGETNIDDLELRCRPHHTRIHHDDPPPRPP